MAAITLSVPDELKTEMEREDRINWSSVARHAFIETLRDLNNLKKVKELNKFDNLLKNSELTDKEIMEMSTNAKKGRFKELKSMGLV